MNPGGPSTAIRPVEIDTASEMYQNGKYMEAKALLDRVLIDFPQNGEAYRCRSFVHYATGNFIEAETDGRQSVLFTPADPHGHYALGLALAAQKKHKDAIVQFDEAVRLEVNHTYAKAATVESLIEHGKSAMAVNAEVDGEAALSRATKLSRQDPRPYIHLATYFQHANQPVKAKKYIEQALAAGIKNQQIDAMAQSLQIYSAGNVQANVAAPAAAKQAVVQAQQMPCPMCKKPVMEWARVCPHCNSQIKDTVGQERINMVGTAWQEVAYRVISVLWIVMAVVSMVMTYVGLRVMQNQAMGLSGLDATPVNLMDHPSLMFVGVVGFIQLVLGVGLLTENDICQFIAKMLSWLGTAFALAGVLVWGLGGVWSFFFKSLADLAIYGFAAYLIGYMSD